MSSSLFWSMGVQAPPGYAPRDVIAVIAMLLGGKLGQSNGESAVSVDGAIVVAQLDDFADYLHTLPIVVDIHNLGLAEAEQLATRIADELNTRGGWTADANPDSLNQKKQPAYF